MTHDQSEAELCGVTIAQAPPIARCPPPPGSRPKGSARLDAESRRRIGRNLRLLYADVLSQPLPDRFVTLLTDLSARDETGGAA